MFMVFGPEFKFVVPKKRPEAHTAKMRIWFYQIFVGVKYEQRLVVRLHQNRADNQK